MTEAEARRVCEILVLADHGCQTCVNELMGRFVDAFPENKGVAMQVWYREFPGQALDWEPQEEIDIDWEDDDA